MKPSEIIEKIQRETLISHGEPMNSEFRIPAAIDAIKQFLDEQYEKEQ